MELLSDRYVRETRQRLDRAENIEKEYREQYDNTGDETFSKLAEYYKGMKDAYVTVLKDFEELRKYIQD